MAWAGSCWVVRLGLPLDRLDAARSPGAHPAPVEGRAREHGPADRQQRAASIAYATDETGSAITAKANAKNSTTLVRRADVPVSGAATSSFARVPPAGSTADQPTRLPGTPPRQRTRATPVFGWSLRDLYAEDAGLSGSFVRVKGLSRACG